MLLRHSRSHDSKAESEGDGGGPALAFDLANQDFCLSMRSSQSCVWVFLLHVCTRTPAHTEVMFHCGFVRKQFLNGSSAKNRIRFGLKLGCHSIPWAPLSTLSGENAGPFYAFCWMKGRTQILENITLFVFLDCWSFLVPLSVLPGTN